LAAKLRANPWPIYKIKLGGPEDIALVRALRAVTSAPFRVDANAAWTTEDALEKIPLLHALGVELVEQPLAKDNWEGMKRLYETSPIPLIADESCVSEHDVEKCAGYFHGINIKLTKCSGITPARRMIEKARSLGLRVMGGSMNESSVGTAALAHLGPLMDYADFDGPLLLDGDSATGLGFMEGRVVPSGEPGLGVTIDPNLRFS
jgi:L-alanine-DL-glutamate epimerase-like enolase superfamily enzyme